MSVTDSRNYSLTFGLLAGVIPPDEAAYGAQGLSEEEMATLERGLCNLAEDEGLMAAAYRITQRHRKDTVDIGNIQVTRIGNGAVSWPSFKIEVDGRPVYDSRQKLIMGGLWMKSFQQAADALPIFKYEMGHISVSASHSRPSFGY